LIDKDGGGTLSTDEIVTAVKEDKEVIKFLETCGEPNLQFLLQPKRLERALKVLDTSNDGEVDVDECAARRLTSHPIDATLLDGVAVRFSDRVHPILTL
jgi:Ca2+-binding EF-hand superfamily protein